MPLTGGHQIFLGSSFIGASWRVGAVTGVGGSDRIYRWYATFPLSPTAANIRQLNRQKKFAGFFHKK
jgi:hypothetical protein